MYRILLCGKSRYIEYLANALPAGRWEVHTCAPAELSSCAMALKPAFLTLAADGSQHGLAGHLLSLYRTGQAPYLFLAFFPQERKDNHVYCATTRRIKEDPAEENAAQELFSLTRAFLADRELTAFSAFTNSFADAERNAAAVEIIEGVSENRFRALRETYALPLTDSGLYLMLIARPVRDYYNDFTDNRDVYLLLRYAARLQAEKILAEGNGGLFIPINAKTDGILINDFSPGPLAGHTPQIIRIANRLYNATNDGLSAHFISHRIEEITGVNAAFRELMRIKNYRLFLPERKIISPDDLRGRKEKASYVRLQAYLDRAAAFSPEMPDAEIKDTLHSLFSDYLQAAQSLTEYYYTCSSLNILFSEFCRRYGAETDLAMIPVEYQWWNGIRTVEKSYIACFLDAKHRITESLRYGSSVRAVMRHIEACFSEPLTLPDLAALAGLQPAYLSSKFRKETGMTVSGYITRCRIEHAKYLLRSTTKSIREIAEETGYRDIKYFSKIFTQKTGQTPSAFRSRPV